MDRGTGIHTAHGEPVTPHSHLHRYTWHEDIPSGYSEEPLASCPRLNIVDCSKRAQ